MKKILVLIILVIGIYFGYTYFIKKDETPKFIYQDILNNIKENKVEVNTFTIYGKYLNLKGSLPSLEEEYQLVFKNNEEEIVINTLSDGNTFYTSKYINDGINLDNMKIGNYLILLHNKTNNTYYNLINKTNYHDNKYYTITQNNKNNLITFEEKTFDNINYWTIDIKEEKLPNEVYDIVIDPGHGGIDTGASNGKYHESTFTLDYAKTLKEVLEKEGFKVKLTREIDKQIDNYGEGSRTGIAYETKAKLYLSIHLNSATWKGQNGVEIYYAYEDNNAFPKLIADNVVKYANTAYSNNPQNKVLAGAYMRVYSSENIKALKEEAKKEGYEPYDFTNHETYYYFIRETGGIMTHAFSDGRNKKYKENIYRNYNQGSEAYLLELGYISNNNDIKNIINNKDGYIKALTTSVLSYAKIKESNEENK